MSTSAQINANRANAQHSTGPKSEEGRATSSKNSLSHGLNASFTVLKWESQEDYRELEKALIAEHKPSGPTEKLLIRQMAESHWLRQRAVFLQDCSILEGGERLKDISLFVRYQNTHDRAFYKAFNEFQKLRNQKYKELIGFDSEAAKACEENRKALLHQRRIALLDLKIKGEDSKQKGEQMRKDARDSRPQNSPKPETPPSSLQTAA